MTPLFDQLCTQLQLAPDSRGEVWMRCPWCGKGNKHFSFSERGYNCFSCDEKGKSLHRLAEQLNICSEARSTMPLRRSERAQERPKQWQRAPERWLDHYCGALDRVIAWQRYKPLSLESIARFRLGVGRLPSSRCTSRRLILPVYDGDAIVAFHGRAFRDDDHDAKWLTAAGSRKDVLFVAGDMHPGCMIIICENFVDAILAAQIEPSAVYVAGGGAAWHATWTAQIAAVRPAQVLVWLDNDLAGCPSAETYRALKAAWRSEHPSAWRIPAPRGPRIANDLLAAGVSARVYSWPRGTPAKADIGWALQQERLW